MRTKRITMRAVAGLILTSGVCGTAAAQNADAILAREPAQPGVVVTTPTGADLAACKAEQMSWPNRGTPPRPA